MKNKGITLLALVITIILLLILAGVTLNLTLGENGMIRKALYARDEYLNGSKKEQEQLENLYSEMKIATNGEITINIEDLNRIIDERIAEKDSDSKSKNPTGTIISYMGNNAPEGYLFCDGTTYNIIEYSKLAEQIKSEFGSYNYWGGDGETTFCVPNLQGEFLRGYSKTPESSMSFGAISGNVGKHQNATSAPIISNTLTSDEKASMWYHAVKGGGNNTVLNADTISNVSGNNRYEVKTAYETVSLNTWSTTSPITYTSRPTNTAVLYCIKY